MPCDRIAGPHRLYYAPYGVTITQYIGQTGEEGINQVREMKHQMITSDEYGPDAPVDSVFQGQSMYLEFVVQEVNKDIVQMMLHPFQCEYSGGAVNAVKQEMYGVPGRLQCQVQGTLEAIPISFSPAAAFAGGSAAGTAIDYPGGTTTGHSSGRKYYGIVINDIAESMDARARMVPVRFQCFPWVDVGDSNKTKMWKWITAYTSA